MPDGNENAKITDALARVAGSAAEDIQDEYDQFYEWMMSRGKYPQRLVPLSDATAKNYLDRLDQVHRAVIERADPDDIVTIREDAADEVIRLLARDTITKRSGEPFAESGKRKFVNALEKYFEWKFHEGSRDYEWQPKIKFSQSNHTSAAKFTYEELGRVLDEAESFGSLPAYYESSEDERQRINGLVAQRLSIPKDKVERADWLRADFSSKIYSLVTVSYDAGLTPVEIAAAETSWYDPQRQTFQIPTEHACKQREKEEVALADESVDALSEWLQERRHLEKYDGSTNIWLNRVGNPYSSGSLCNLLCKICDQAAISTENRAIRWYSLRHTMGRNVTEEGDLSEANDQLRHEHLESTKDPYDDTPIEKLLTRINTTHEKAGKAASDPDYDPFDEDDGTESTATEAAGTADETPQYPDEVETRTGGGNVHIDTMIADTPTARVDLTRKILPGDDDETQA